MSRLTVVHREAERLPFVRGRFDDGAQNRETEFIRPHAHGRVHFTRGEHARGASDPHGQCHAETVDLLVLRRRVYGDICVENGLGPSRAGAAGVGAARSGTPRAAERPAA